MSNTPTSSSQSGPLRCASGSLVAGSLALVLYRLTISIAGSLAANPIHSQNPTALSISAAVRTLVVGMSALGTGIFGIASLGLMALAIQLLAQRLFKSTQQPPNSQP